MTQSLKNKVAVITGASQGIGRAIAIGYAQQGARVVCAARNDKALNETVKTIHSIGYEAIAIPTDVCDEVAVKTLFKKTETHFGGIDILVANAGVNLDKNSVEGSKSHDWKRTFEVNLFGAYYCLKHVIPYLKQRESGKIITIGSGLGHRGIPNDSAYACSKAALWMLTQVVAQELAEENISVNELIPGPVETAMSTEAFKTNVVKKYKDWLKQPEDVVPLAVFLASQPAWSPSAQSYSLMRRAT